MPLAARRQRARAGRRDPAGAAAERSDGAAPAGGRAGVTRLRAAQVVLARNKKEPGKFAALKVVYLQSPQMVDDPEHLAIMKRCAAWRPVAAAVPDVHGFV